jgi:hypothetical protein
MSMPVIRRISNLSGEAVFSEWILWTSKNRIIYVKYDKGELSCRYDNRNNKDRFFYVKSNKDKSSTMTTEEMLRRTRFKLNNDPQMSPELLAHCMRHLAA